MYTSHLDAAAFHWNPLIYLLPCQLLLSFPSVLMWIFPFICQNLLQLFWTFQTEFLFLNLSTLSVSVYWFMRDCVWVCVWVDANTFANKFATYFKYLIMEQMFEWWEHFLMLSGYKMTSIKPNSINHIYPANPCTSSEAKPPLPLITTTLPTYLLAFNYLLLNFHPLSSWEARIQVESP